MHMYVIHIIINPCPSWIEIYKYFDVFYFLCMSIDAWCIFVSIKYDAFEGYNHG